VGQFITGEAARERFRELLDQVDAAYGEMRTLSSDEVGNAYRVEMAQRLETQERTNRGLMYRMFGQIVDPPDEDGFVPALADRLWARLRIPPNEIKRRMKLAGRLRPRRQLSGPPLPPELPLVAWPNSIRPPTPSPTPTSRCHRRHAPAVTPHSRCAI
jgi:Domain of unknown function (DUF222)